MRLDKYLATVTDFSRSEAKKAIKAGRVIVCGEHTLDRSVGGIKVVNSQYDLSVSSAVYLDDELLRPAQPRYFMLYKPEGYVSAAKDRVHLAALELLDEDNVDQLHIAGRLDIDATGLLLITDDGKWSHRVTAPSRDCKKIYLVETVDLITQEMIHKIEQGLYLTNEKRRTKPAKIELLDEHTARLTISEGKYHQVKRMFAAVENKVDMLHREKIGSITLDSELAPGEYRVLTEVEISSL